MTEEIIYPMGINLTLKIISGKWKPPSSATLVHINGVMEN
ncbi:hypothetical protein LWHH1689_0154 [Limosilactobacillus reuteri]|uniref:Uncharacterized protein n=1 Tax=Limosilactobacillus reuteri TaxID=1598 RepID=A0A2S1ENI4_LIMRT|nr:hypothetical protein LWHH1689_0154 [Limosilactobacillus reuteri]